MLIFLSIISRKRGDNMPYRDGTGPEGKGPRTGRGLGNCADNETKTDNTAPARGFGLGLGRGRGAGRGLGRGWGFNRNN